MLEVYGNRILAGVLCALSGAMLAASVFWINGGPPLIGSLLGAATGFAWGYNQAVQDVFLAGLTFAVAQFAALLIVYIFMRPMAPAQYWLKNWAPLGESGWICGSLVGILILSSPRLRKGWQATIFGACVGSISCWVFICLGYYADRQPSPGWDWILLWVICLAWASMAPASLLGCLLYRVCNNRQMFAARQIGSGVDQTLELNTDLIQQWQKDHDEPNTEDA